MQVFKYCELLARPGFWQAMMGDSLVHQTEELEERVRRDDEELARPNSEDLSARARS